MKFRLHLRHLAHGLLIPLGWRTFGCRTSSCGAMSWPRRPGRNHWEIIGEIYQELLVGGLEPWNLWLSIIYGNSHPKWPIFVRGVETTNQNNNWIVWHFGHIPCTWLTIVTFHSISHSWVEEFVLEVLIPLPDLTISLLFNWIYT